MQAGKSCEDTFKQIAELRKNQSEFNEKTREQINKILGSGEIVLGEREVQTERETQKESENERQTKTSQKFEGFDIEKL